jgi:hypothetical protein
MGVELDLVEVSRKAFERPLFNTMTVHMGERSFGSVLHEMK